MSDNTIAVFGAGSYGTALAMCLARNGVDTLLHARNAEHVDEMRTKRENQRYLPSYPFPDSLALTDNIEHAVNHANDLLVVVPSHAFAQCLTHIAPFLHARHRVVWATKGLEPETGRLLEHVADEIIGPARPKGILSGPTFAKEMAAGLPTAISLAATDNAFAQDIANKLHCSKSFRVYLNNDFTGVQLGGAVKNVIAIGAGLADGLGFGANARTALITRGLVEMTRLGSAIGAQPETFMGMAGLGDLVLTCTDDQSRNRRFGLALGQGKPVEQAIADIGQVVEGQRNTQEVFVLAQKHGIEMPITEEIYAILYQNKPAKEAAIALLSRQPTSE
ncbi:MAG: NAD(P)H-dependent glycerol-3-phosphate dehydrogenase [Glaciecola sp.]|jgi:glycerol-3-phosphate dehydrogenase (NAD(P)+)